MRYAFTASQSSISIFFNGKMHNIPKSNAHFDELYEHLKLDEHDFEFIERAVDKPKLLERLTQGMVSVIGSTVYYAGTPIRTTLAAKLLEMLDAGFDARPWALFLERVMANPSDRSRECLFDFLDHFKAPVTEDGHFLAFKRVRKDFKDIYTGTMDNSPGNIVEVPRHMVDADPNRTCSHGLHVAASAYLNEYASASENRTLVCKVDPADVVAVPGDYGFAKMRVCKYLVLGEVEENTMHHIEQQAVSYVGTEPAKGDLTDANGEPICYNATDFSTYWKREEIKELAVGNRVVARVESSINGENPYLVGTVTEIELGETPTLLVTWQDGRETIHVGHGDLQVVSKRVVAAEEEDESTIILMVNVVDEDDEDDVVDTETSELAFSRNGVTITASALKAGIKQHGQRGYSRLTGIPRTTLQDWLSRL